jgi:hypothetical protein
MSEQYKGLKQDGTLTFGTLSLKSNNRKERESILKEYLSLSGAVKLVKVHGDEGPCYEEVNI